MVFLKREPIADAITKLHQFLEQTNHDSVQYLRFVDELSKDDLLSHIDIAQRDFITLQQDWEHVNALIKNILEELHLDYSQGQFHKRSGEFEPDMRKVDLYILNLQAALKKVRNPDIPSLRRDVA